MATDRDVLQSKFQGIFTGGEAAFSDLLTTLKRVLRRRVFTIQHVGASSLAEQPVFVADTTVYPNGCQVLSVTAVDTAGLVTGSTNYVSYIAKVYDSAGSSLGTVVTTSTRASGMNGIAALVPESLGTLSSTVVPAGGVVTFAATVSNTISAATTFTFNVEAL